MDLQVEFVSTLAQAQRAVGVQSVDRLLGTVGAVAGLRPEVVDKIDADQIIDAYADMLGVDPSLIVADDKVAVIRQQRAQQQQQQQRQHPTGGYQQQIPAWFPQHAQDALRGMQGVA